MFPAGLSVKIRICCTPKRLDKPKSAIFGIIIKSINIFSGLRSRWRIRYSSWRKHKPLQIALIISYLIFHSRSRDSSCKPLHIHLCQGPIQWKNHMWCLSNSRGRNIGVAFGSCSLFYSSSRKIAISRRLIAAQKTCTVQVEYQGAGRLSDCRSAFKGYQFRSRPNGVHLTLTLSLGSAH